MNCLFEYGKRLSKIETLDRGKPKYRILGGAGVSTESGIPRCECGGIIRPGVVMFGDPLDSHVLQNAVKAIREADMLIVGGTLSDVVADIQVSAIFILNNKRPSRPSWLRGFCAFMELCFNIDVILSASKGV